MSDEEERSFSSAWSYCWADRREHRYQRHQQPAFSAEEWVIAALSRMKVLLRGLVLFPLDYIRKRSYWYLQLPLDIPAIILRGDWNRYQLRTWAVLGSTAAGGCCVNGEAISALSELWRQKAITGITPCVNRVLAYWKRCVLLRTWPRGHRQFPWGIW